MGIQAADGADGELRLLAVAHQIGADIGGAIHGHADGQPHFRLLEQAAGVVEAQKLQNGGVRVGIAAAGGGHVAPGAGHVVGQQVHVVGGKGVGGGLLTLIGQQIDLIKGQRHAAPPVGVALQQLGAAGLGVRPGAGGEGVVFRTGLDDGDIQQRGEVPAVLGQLDGHGVAAGRLDGGHIRQAGGVAGGLLGPKQRGAYILRCQRRAVTEMDAAAQTDGVGEGLRVVVLALGQHPLRLKLRGQAVQRLVQQGGQRQLNAVAAGDGIQCLAAEIGQGKGGQGGSFLHGVGLVVLGQLAQGIIGIGALVPVGAAGQGQERQRRQQQRRNASFHSVSSSEIMAI